MDGLKRHSFKPIIHTITFHPDTAILGMALSLNNISRANEYLNLDKSGIIQCSMTQKKASEVKSYNVIFEINQQRRVTTVYCNCSFPVNGNCEHIYALLAFVNVNKAVRNNNENCTATSVRKNMDGTTSEHVAELRPVTLQTALMPLNLVDKRGSDSSKGDPIHQILMPISDSQTPAIVPSKPSVVSIVSNADEIESCRVAALNLLIFSSENQHYISLRESVDEKLSDFYDRHIFLTSAEVVDLCVRTLNRSHSTEWFFAERLRITANSVAHAIKKRKKRPISTLITEFFTKSPACLLSRSNEYSRNMEERAIAYYETLMKARVVQIGLFVSPLQPWLSACPNGVVINDGQIERLFEVKCPYSCRKKSVWDTIKGIPNVPFLRQVGNIIELRKDHDYYTECQVNMYTTGLNVCDVLVWSPFGSYCVSVHRDEPFLQWTIPKLENFYFHHYLAAAYKDTFH